MDMSTSADPPDEDWNEETDPAKDDVRRMTPPARSTPEIPDGSQCCESVMLPLWSFSRLDLFSFFLSFLSRFSFFSFLLGEMVGADASVKLPPALTVGRCACDKVPFAGVPERNSPDIA
jgi:hypothetical protein